MADESSSRWIWEQDKAFEVALATYLDDGNVNCLERIAAQVPGKSVESGQVPIPSYSDKDCSRAKNATVKERRKGNSWSVPEHRLFLQGLAACGKGDWKRISREFVIRRTPQQVASHAQKFFNRQNVKTQHKKRSSIHDINTVDEDNQLENVYAGNHGGNIYSSGQMEGVNYPEYEIRNCACCLSNQGGNIYASDQMEGVAYPEYEIRDAYAPIAVDRAFYLGNQTNDAGNQNPMGNASYPEYQTNNANNDHYGQKDNFSFVHKDFFP